MKQLSSHERAMIDGIDQAAMLAQVEQWCAINSGTGNLAGLAQQAGLLVDAFAQIPGDLVLIDAPHVASMGADGQEKSVENGRHLVLRVRPKAARRVLLTGHMDTVFPPSDPFQRLTWLDDHTVNGPGVADMKGGIAVILAALKAFETAPAAVQIGYDVLINSDEETGSLSSAPLIADLAGGKLAALTYEPSALPDGTLAGARGGSGNFAVLICGKSAHAGRNPQDGRNAIVAAAALVLGLKALEGEGLAINPARIDGGAANNVVPDIAVVRFNTRPASLELAQQFDTGLQHLLAKVQAEYGVQMTVQGGLSRPPKPLDPPAERLFNLVKHCGEMLGQRIRWQHSGGVCDGNNIAACGVPVVDTMGVRGGAIHSPDEFLIVASLAERAALSALVLHHLAEGSLS